jgi:hypothetical protein
MGAGETTQGLSIELRPDEPEVQISLVEFDYYCTLFEEMLEEMETSEYRSFEPNEGVDFPRGYEIGELDLDECLDEFDLAEIEQMRERYGLSGVCDNAGSRELRLLL